MAKEVKFNERQQRLLDYVRSKFPYVDDQTWLDAKAYAGYSENTSVSDVMRHLGPKLEGEIADLLYLYGLEAAGKQVQIMRNPGKNWRAEHAASNNILEKIGMGKKEDDKTLTPVGIVILPAKDVVVGDSDDSGAGSV